MKSFRFIVPVLGIVATLGVAGCSGSESTNTGSAQNAVTADQAKDQSNEGPHARHGHAMGGPEMLIFASLHENINLTPEQRSTIEGLIEKRGERDHAPDKAKTAELAAAIRSGNVSNANVQSNHADRTAALATKLGTLHDTLTADQRSALVDAIVAKQAQHKARGEHVAREAKPEWKDREGMGPMGQLLEGLDLTQAQKDQIKAKLEADRPAKPNVDFAALKKDMDAKLQSFKGDSFDANAFVTPPAGMPKFDGANRMAKDLQVVVSVLDPAQREKLAQKIELGPQARTEMRAR